MMTKSYILEGGGKSKNNSEKILRISNLFLEKVDFEMEFFMYFFTL